MRKMASARAVLLSLAQKVLDVGQDVERASYLLTVGDGGVEPEGVSVCAACYYPLDREPDTTILVGHTAVWICDGCTEGGLPIEVRRRDVDGRVVSTMVSHTRGRL